MATDPRQEPSDEQLEKLSAWWERWQERNGALTGEGERN